MIHLLIGANAMQARAWCEFRLMSVHELGRTVFTTRVHTEHDLFGRKDFIRFVFLEDNDWRSFSTYSRRDERMIAVARSINSVRGFR